MLRSATVYNEIHYSAQHLSAVIRILFSLPLIACVKFEEFTTGVTFTFAPPPYLN